MRNSIESEREKLRVAIANAFSLDDINEIIFDLNLDKDNFPEIKNPRIIALIDHHCKHKTLERLRTKLEESRPRRWNHILWDNVYSEQDDFTLVPYQGLNFYDVDDWEKFHGRSELILEIIGRINQENLNFFAIIGASGSGKSSLARAGIISTLTNRSSDQRFGIPLLLEREEWLTCIMKPGTNPIEELAIALTDKGEGFETFLHLKKDLGSNIESLSFHIKRLLRKRKKNRFLLLVDQFEESFTQTKDPNIRQAFIDNLMYVIKSQSAENVLILITLRADFYNHCGEYESLREVVASQQKYIGRMNRRELVEVIEKPVNGQLQPGLTNSILKDLGTDPGELTLLSHALSETWLDSRPEMMSIFSYESVGGVKSAIAQTADAFYNQLADDEKFLMQELMIQLTVIGDGTEDTRRRVSIEELEDLLGAKNNIRSLIIRLADTRLVTTDRKLLLPKEGEEKFVDIVQVTHESIIRHWRRLENWLRINRTFLLWHQIFRDDVSSWEEAGRPVDHLYGELRLLEAQEWHEKVHHKFSPVQKAFLDASKQEESRRKALEIEGVLAFSRINLPISDRQSGSLKGEQRLFQKLFLLDRVESDHLTMLQKLDNAADSLYYRENLFSTFSPDGKFLVYGDPARNVNLWEWQVEDSPIQVGPPRRNSNIWWVTFSADGKLLVTPGSFPGSFEVWDLNDFSKPLYVLKGLSFGIAQPKSFAISSNSKWVAGGGVGGGAGIWDIEDEGLASQALLDGRRNRFGQIVSMHFSATNNWLGARNEKDDLFFLGISR